MWSVITCIIKNLIKAIKGQHSDYYMKFQMLPYNNTLSPLIL